PPHPAGRVRCIRVRLDRQKTTRQGRRAQGLVRVENFVQIGCDCRTRPRKWRGVAPTFSSAIVPACSRKPRDLRLYLHPEIAWSPSEFKDDRRVTCPRTKNIQIPAANIDGPSNLRQALFISFLAGDFVKTADNQSSKSYDDSQGSEFSHQSFQVAPL